MIFDYVAKSSGSSHTARDYLKRLRDRCMKIGNAPFGGIARDDIARGMRMSVFERRVVILYNIEEETVWITTVISGDRDYAALLRTKPKEL